ncbi:MAG: hypothetical protein ACC652_02510 [Acidimicrobiales bacterium]
MEHDHFTDDTLHGTRALVLSAAMALVIFSFVAVLTFLGGGSSEAPSSQGRLASVLSQTEDTDPSAPDSFSATAGGFSAGIETFEVFGGRNPFERPISFESGTTLPGDTSTTQPGDTGTTNPDGSGSGTESTTTQTTSLDPTQRRTVELKEIYSNGTETVANVQVDGILYTELAEGDVFATTFKVVSLSLAEQCGDFLNGDVAFELCVGESILK